MSSSKHQNIETHSVGGDDHKGEGAHSLASPSQLARLVLIDHRRIIFALDTMPCVVREQRILERETFAWVTQNPDEDCRDQEGAVEEDCG